MFRRAVLIVAILSSALNAQDHENVELVGRIYNQWDFAYDVEVVGNLAYVAAGISGLQVVDISDPEHPEVIWYEEDIYAEIIEISGDYAYVLGGWLLVGGVLHIWDISDPENPLKSSEYSTLEYPRDMVIHGDYAYIVDAAENFGEYWRNGFLYIVDISNPESPVTVGRYDMAGDPFGVDISGDYAYVTEEPTWGHMNFIGGGLCVIDISDPHHPEGVGYYNEHERFNDITISGNIAYIWYRENIDIVNISDPEEPRVVGSYHTPGNVRDFKIMEDIAFVAAGDLRILSLSNPIRPIELGYCDTPGSASGVSVADDFSCVTDSDDGLRVVNIANLENPEEVGYYSHPGAAYDIVVSGGYAYVADYKSGLRVLDIQDSGNPSEVGFLDPSWFARDIAIQEEFVYLTDVQIGDDGDEFGGGLRIVNISDPENPAEEGYYDSPGSAWDVTVSGDYAYIADGREGLRIVDITNPENPEEVGYYETPQAASAVTAFGDYVFVIDGFSNGLFIIRISDPGNPEEVGFYYINGPHDIAVKNGYACLIKGSDFVILNISDPENPHEVGNCEVLGTAYNVAVYNDYAYVVGYYGLHVINIHEPENPFTTGYYETPGCALGITISEDGLIYVADQTNVGIYRFTDPVGVDDSLIPLPSSLFLSPAYPNPFNSSTTIVFHLPIPSPVNVAVHDIAGRQVATLCDSWRGAGENRLSFNPVGLPSGVYLLSLSAREIKLNQKVVLLK